MSRLELLIELIQWVFIITTFLRINWLTASFYEFLSMLNRVLLGAKERNKDGDN